MAKRVIGTPISVQEHRETLSATVDVESGMTDFIIQRTLTDADSKEVICSQRIRETSPTGDVAKAISEAVAKSQENAPEPEPEV
jgi:hypothetical protein